jgi:tRNA A-37 threonylcarbamoyl transferase component Bud32/membrane-associated phospholipid phosphatase
VTTVPSSRTPEGPIAPVVARSGRRRRPSGEPPPLPRHIDPRTLAYAALSGLAVAGTVAMTAAPVLRVVTDLDRVLQPLFLVGRSAHATDAAQVIAALASTSVLRPLAWATLLVLLATRHLRHVVVYVLATLVASGTVAAGALAVGRPRPLGVDVVGHWAGYAFPSRPVAGLAMVLVTAILSLIPRGSWRTRAALAVAAVVTVIAVARIHLALDAPSDALVGALLGAFLPALGFRLLAPSEVFPVTYRRRPSAHLELSPVRRAAIAHALDQQLGLTLDGVEPFGLEGSAGSTPLRLRVHDNHGAPIELFGKLYAVTHLRSDRWYKLMRTVLYGRLEDEKPFSTVRRLVEYEDHLLRLLRDAGLPVPAPHGFVEITPEREYLVVMEFFAGARELGSAPVSDPEIDSGLRVVRMLWEAGVAHRDLKPSNLLVRDSQVLLIDVAFATVRPTPWRQAVDLANMMLTLALVSSARQVYDRALLQFADADLAEAFAATRSVTLPTQLRRRLRDDPRDLLAELRSLAPPREPVGIQLWSVRRALVTAAVALALLLAIALAAGYAQVVGQA